MGGTAGHAPLDTGQAMGSHTGAGGQCADAVEACVGDDRPAHMHTGAGSGVLGRANGGDGAAYVMPGWAGRMASQTYGAVWRREGSLHK